MRRFRLGIRAAQRSVKPSWQHTSHLLAVLTLCALPLIATACAPTLPARQARTPGSEPTAGATAPSPRTPRATLPKLPPPETTREPLAPQPQTPALNEERAPRAPTLTPPQEPAQIKVALLLPLSGPSAAIGGALLEAAELAIFDVGDSRLALLPRDTGGTPEGAARAAQAALSEGAELILGPLFATSVRAVAPLARERGINLVAFSTDTSVAGGGTYLMGFAPDQQVDRVVGYAVRQGLTRFAALAPDTAYGRAVAEALRRALARHGGQLVQAILYDPTVEDLSPIVRELADYDRRHSALVAQRRSLKGRTDSISVSALKRLQRLDTLGELGFDAIMLPEGGNRLKAIAPLLPFYDIDPDKIRLLGTGLWDEPGMGTEPALVGGWFAGPPLATATAFRERFRATYGKYPPRIASLAYDAVALAAVLSRDTRTPRFSAEAINSSSGFAGFDGIFRFASDGVAERGLAIIQVESNGLRVIDPAPESFETLSN